MRVKPCGHSPHNSPQPSGPHALPAQIGAQVQLPSEHVLPAGHEPQQLAHGELRIDCSDHVAGEIVEVSMSDLRFEPCDPFSFRLVDAGGQERAIPLRRVRRVTLDGVVIWKRPGLRPAIVVGLRPHPYGGAEP